MSRSDDKTFLRLWRDGVLFKWVILLLVGANAVLAIALVLAARKPIQTVAVLPNGAAAWTGSVSEEMRRNLAIHDTREFIECLHSRDALLGPAARKKAIWYMAPNLRDQVHKMVADSSLLVGMAQSGYQSTIEWDVPPMITDWNYPGVSIYSAFTVVTKDPAGKIERTKQNFVIGGTFLPSTETRPSGYLITRFKYVTDTRELNTILNKIGG